MPDVLTLEQRRHCMSSIRSRDTTPEMVVRKLAYSLGYRYRLHVSSLPGRPDLVFPSRRKAILVHGCFWHRHRCKKGRSIPATRREFWKAKLEANKARDKRNHRALRRLGWDVLVVWECQTKHPDKLIDRLVRFMEA